MRIYHASVPLLPLLAAVLFPDVAAGRHVGPHLENFGEFSYSRPSHSH